MDYALMGECFGTEPPPFTGSPLRLTLLQPSFLNVISLVFTVTWIPIEDILIVMICFINTVKWCMMRLVILVETFSNRLSHWIFSHHCVRKDLWNVRKRSRVSVPEPELNFAVWLVMIWWGAMFSTSSSQGQTSGRRWSVVKFVPEYQVCCALQAGAVIYVYPDAQQCQLP